MEQKVINIVVLGDSSSSGIGIEKALLGMKDRCIKAVLFAKQGTSVYNEV